MPRLEIDLISADHQNKPDVGVNIGSMDRPSRRSIVLRFAVQASVLRSQSREGEERRQPELRFGVVDLTGARVAETVHWVYDTWMLANGTGRRWQVRRRQLVLS